LIRYVCSQSLQGENEPPKGRKLNCQRNFTVCSKKSLPGLGYRRRSTDKEQANIQKSSRFWFFDANRVDGCLYHSAVKVGTD